MSETSCDVVMYQTWSDVRFSLDQQRGLRIGFQYGITAKRAPTLFFPLWVSANLTGWASLNYCLVCARMQEMSGIAGVNCDGRSFGGQHFGWGSSLPTT